MVNGFARHPAAAAWMYRTRVLNLVLNLVHLHAPGCIDLLVASLGTTTAVANLRLVLDLVLLNLYYYICTTAVGTAVLRTVLTMYIWVLARCMPAPRHACRPVPGYRCPLRLPQYLGTDAPEYR